MHIDNDKMMPGDLLELRCQDTGILHQWRVIGIYLGASGQESLIEITPVDRKPGTDSLGNIHARMFVPEPMTRALDVFRVGLQTFRPSKQED